MPTGRWEGKGEGASARKVVSNPELKQSQFLPLSKISLLFLWFHSAEVYFGEQDGGGVRLGSPIKKNCELGRAGERNRWFSTL